MYHINNLSTVTDKLMSDMNAGCAPNTETDIKKTQTVCNNENILPEDVRGFTIKAKRRNKILRK
jgi:hypothetical protein